MAKPKTHTTRLCLSLTLLFCAVLAGCVRSDRTSTQASAQPAQTAQLAPDAASPASPSPTAATTPGQPNAPPQSSEVRDALARAYQNAVTVDESRQAGALTADFNGDGSEDIAIIVKPNAAQLSEINSEYANWIVEDPQRVLPPQEIRPGQPTPPAPVKVEAGDTLLAIIHGYKSAGWRNADAKQTYLLKNAVGEQMRAQTADETRRGNTERRPLPFLRGDLIWQKLSGKPGYIFWTGAKYGWYDSPQTSRQRP